MGSGVDGIQGFDAVVGGEEGMAPMRAGGLRLAKLPGDRGYGRAGMGCSSLKKVARKKGAVLENDVGCIVPPNEPIELLVEYIKPGF